MTAVAPSDCRAIYCRIGRLLAQSLLLFSANSDRFMMLPHPPAAPSCSPKKVLSSGVTAVRPSVLSLSQKSGTTVLLARCHVYSAFNLGPLIYNVFIGAGKEEERGCR